MNPDPWQTIGEAKEVPASARDGERRRAIQAGVAGFLLFMVLWVSLVWWDLRAHGRNWTDFAGWADQHLGWILSMLLVPPAEILLFRKWAKWRERKYQEEIERRLRQATSDDPRLKGK